eukprot:PhM_4_TR16699/c0_g1_i1/m.39677
MHSILRSMPLFSTMALLYLLLSSVTLFVAVEPVDAGAGAPLKGTLLCSACEVITRELVKATRKLPGRNPKSKAPIKLTELQFIEVLEKSCASVARYRLAQENHGGHHKVFVDTKDTNELSHVESPEFYDDEDNYGGAVGRLYEMCQQYTDQHENELRQMLEKNAPEKQIRDRLCLRLNKVCDEKMLKAYKDMEKDKRTVWRRMHLREKASKEFQSQMQEELELSELKDELGKHATDELLERSKRKSWHPTNDREEQAAVESRRQRKKFQEEHAKEQRRKYLQEKRKEWEDKQAEIQRKASGMTFEKWLEEREEEVRKAKEEWDDSDVVFDDDIDMDDGEM